MLLYNIKLLQGPDYDEYMPDFNGIASYKSL